jgi:hypothetical protein
VYLAFVGGQRMFIIFYLFICSLFRDIVGSSGCTTANDRIINANNGSIFEGSSHDLI